MSTSHLVIPIVNTTLSTRISLFPHQMNNDIYYNLKYNITQKVQGKCNEFGYVIKVLKIDDYNDGVIDAENFTGSAVYNIRYLASLCVPVEKTQILTKIENINNAIILTTHGPISCVITPEKINTQLFTIELGKYIYNTTKQELTKGDIIKITILSKKLYKNDIMISLGFLDDIATQDEKDNFYKPELFNVDIDVEEPNKLVDFHEDDNDNENNNENNTETNNINQKGGNEFSI